MSAIAIGTTPTVRIKIQSLRADTYEPGSARVYFKQQFGNYVITKKGEDVTIEPDDTDSIFETYLTQKETLGLQKGKIEVEVRWLFRDILPNGDHVAGKSVVMMTAASPTLKSEVII